MHMTNGFNMGTKRTGTEIITTSQISNEIGNKQGNCNSILFIKNIESLVK